MQQPFKQFGEWLDVAKEHAAIKEPTAMTLATATASGIPSARIVLLKDFDENGFVFYTNLESRKSSEIIENSNAALVFYWMPLTRQIRVEGILEPVTDAEADAYFATRARQSQLGAWASKQSRPLDSRTTLMAAVAALSVKYLGRDVPRPPHWSGWRLKPKRIEFWQEAEFRLHDREVFELTADGWASGKLYP